MTKRKRERKTTSKDESFRKIRVVGAKKRFALLIKPNWIRLNLNISFLLALLALNQHTLRSRTAEIGDLHTNIDDFVPI